MAKILSHIDSIRRGSVAGITYTANRYAAIISRSRVSPVNPMTQPQNAIRSAFKFASDRWRDNLTSTERTSWGILASMCPYTGPLGSYHIPGRNLFIAAKTYRQRINELDGAPTIPDADAANYYVGGWFPLGIVTLDAPGAPGTGASLTFTREAGTSDAIATFEISPGFGGSVNYFTGPFISGSMGFLVCAAGTSTNIDILNLTVDRKYFIKIRCLMEDNGANFSQSFIFNFIAKTTV